MSKTLSFIEGRWTVRAGWILVLLALPSMVESLLDISDHFRDWKNNRRDNCK